MLCQRLSAWFGADYGNAVKDVLSGKEHILPLTHVQRHPCPTLSACHFAALNFVRVAFKHMQRARGHSGPSMARWLDAVMERPVLEETLWPCEQLTGERVIQLEEMYRIPLFEGALAHAETKHGSPSMILFKQSLRQMQLNASPVSAMVVSRSASATVCLKRRESFKDVFIVLDFVLAPQEHGRNLGMTPALVISTSLEQTAARMSGILPIDNHLVTRDKQWQAQLFTSCTICMFTPAQRASSSSEAGSSAIRESVALLRVMGEGDDRARNWEGDRNTDMDQNRDRHQRERPSGSRLCEQTSLDAGRAAPTTSHARIESLGEGSNVHVAEVHLKTTFIPYEQTKRYCRIFFADDESSAPTSSSPSPISFSSGTSDEEAYFECVICFEVIPEEEGTRLLPCAHSFCRDCLAGHVCSKIEERKFPVFCPLCMAERENTSPSVVPGELVQRLVVSDALYAIWSELELAHLCIRVHCRRCNRSAFVDREDYEQLKELCCPFQGCRHTWCKNCQQSLSGHGRKHTCDGTAELDYLVKQMGWKYCPACRTPVQKNGGCNHMTCGAPGCNTHFCYQCGERITRTSIPLIVNTAVNAHFKRCTL